MSEPRARAWGSDKRAGCKGLVGRVLTPEAAGFWPRLRTPPAVAVLLGCGLLVSTLSAIGLAMPARSDLLLGLGSAGRPTSQIPLAAPRVVVLKAKRTLHLFDGDRLVRSYPIDLGEVPTGPKRRKGDRRTPIGSFRVVTKNLDSQFHRFIGIGYPDLSTAEWGLAQGLISFGEATSIRRALCAGRCPDWGTALGGGIGIHGRRMARDWTGGCIALSDHHVEELFSVLRMGDPIEILP